MINMQNVACTATFMAFAMCEVNSKYEKLGADGFLKNDIYTVWGKGGIELHLELAQYAEVSEKLVDFITGQCEFDYPGVYDYEVSEPFGAWFTEYLFEHRDVPPRSEGVEKLTNMAVKFFTQCPQEGQLTPLQLEYKVKGLNL